MFVAPTTPSDRGNGLAMRAGVFLDALATSHDVSLLVAPVAGPAPDEWSPFVRDRTTARVCLRHDSDEGDGLSPGRSLAGSARTAAR